MVEVSGLFEGVAYTVAVTGDPARPVEGSRIVSSIVTSAIEAKVQVRTSPTSGRVLVTGDNKAAVLALIGQETSVLSATGLDVKPSREGRYRVE